VNFVVPKILVVGSVAITPVSDAVGAEGGFLVVMSRKSDVDSDRDPAVHSGQKTIFPIMYAMITEETVATMPGSIKLWFKMYFPIRVVPV